MVFGGSGAVGHAIANRTAGELVNETLISVLAPGLKLGSDSKERLELHKIEMLMVVITRNS